MAKKSNFSQKNQVEVQAAPSVAKNETATKTGPIKIFLCLSLLVILTYASFYRTTQNTLTNWDDDRYVAKNAYLHNFSAENLKNMFFGGSQSYFMGNYHPFALVSLGIDYQLSEKDKDGKPDPYLFGLHNLTLHVLNSILVFFFLFYLLKLIRFRYYFEISMIAAFVFAVHTLHVESISWISERKDVLYVYYFIASLLAYVGYLYKKNYAFYALSLLLFVVSCLAKGQAVSLAVTLIAIDYLVKRKWFSVKVLLEKLPFFIIALIFGLIAVHAQKQGEAVHSMFEYTVLERFTLSSYGLLMYILKLVFPFSLSAMYPYTVLSSYFPFYWWFYSLTPVAVAVVFYLVVKKSLIKAPAAVQSVVVPKKDQKGAFAQRKPAVASVKEVDVLESNEEQEVNNWHLMSFVIMFFMVNIVLLLQFIPVGSAIYSDRYVYVSSIAYSLLVGYLYKLVKDKRPSLANVYIGLIVVYVGLLSVLSFNRVAVWKDSISLWSDVIEKDELAVVAYNNRGSALKEVNRVQDAIADFTKAIGYKPDYKSSLYNRGTAYKDINKLPEALADFNKALLLDPNFVEAYHNRGLTYDLMGQAELAIKDFNKALTFDANDVKVYVNRGVCYGKTNRMDLAIADFNKALVIDPKNSDAYSDLGLAHSHKQIYDKAIEYYNKAIELKPKFTDAYFNRAIAYRNMKKMKEAIADLSAAIASKQNFSMAYFQRGEIYKEINKKNEACSDFQKARELGLKMPVLDQELQTYCGK